MVAQVIGLVVADIDDEKVMLSIETGKYYGLDSIGSRIWELIEQPNTVCNVVKVLLTEYEVDDRVCTNDVMAFLHKLYAQGMVDIV